MPITYTNRKGVTYHLCRTATKTGKPRYVFAREPRGEPVEEIPEGWRISESVNGIVSLVKAQPSQILPEELAAVEAAVGRHPGARDYRVADKRDRIEVYERVGPVRPSWLRASPGWAWKCAAWSTDCVRIWTAARSLRRSCVSS
jgi:hypothetical protein